MGYFLAFMTIMIWSVNIILAKYFAGDLLPLQMSFGRWLVAAICLLPFTASSLWKNRSTLAQNWNYILALALLGVVLSNTLIYMAASTTDAINIGLLQITFPLFLTALSVLYLKTKICKDQLLGILIAIAGVVTVLARDGFDKLLEIRFQIGDVLMLLNTLAFSFYSFIQAVKKPKLSHADVLAATAIVGSVILFPLTYIFEGLPVWTMKNAEAFIYLGTLNSVVAFLFWNIALAKIGPVKAGMFFYLMPILAAVAGYFMFAEKIVPLEIWGGALIVIGLFLLNRKDLKKANPQNNAT